MDYIAHIISGYWRNWFGKIWMFDFECTWYAKFGIRISSRHLEMRYWDWLQIFRFGVIWMKTMESIHSANTYLSFHCVSDNCVVRKVSWSLTDKELTLWKELWTVFQEGKEPQVCKPGAVNNLLFLRNWKEITKGLEWGEGRGRTAWSQVRKVGRAHGAFVGHTGSLDFAKKHGGKTYEGV